MDGDGINDVLTGSYSPGHLYLYRGLGKGEYAAGVKLTDVDGKEIAIQSASTPAAIDLNGDKKLDLVVGFISGRAQLLINKGALKFAKPQDLMAGGKPIEGSNLGISVADWDGDRTPDLIVGDGQGVVTWYRGTKTAGGMTFAAGKPLVDAKLFTDPEDRPAYRAKASVADWNGDGKLDLLVGDFSSSREEPKNLTQAQRDRAKQLELDQRTQSLGLSRQYGEIVKKVAKVLGYEPGPDTDKERTDKFNAAVQEELKNSKTYQDAMKKYMALNEELRPLLGNPRMDGFVRVYLRK